MKKPISRPVHGLLDYSYVAVVAAVPELAHFKKEKDAAELCHFLSGGALASTLFTRSERGLVRILPFKAHLALDLLSGLGAIASPWLLGFSKNKKARNALIVIGMVGVVVSLLSKEEEMP